MNYDDVDFSSDFGNLFLPHFIHSNLPTICFFEKFSHRIKLLHWNLLTNNCVAFFSIMDFFLTRIRNMMLTINWTKRNSSWKQRLTWLLLLSACNKWEKKSLTNGFTNTIVVFGWEMTVKKIALIFYKNFNDFFWIKIEI